MNDSPPPEPTNDGIRLYLWYPELLSSIRWTHEPVWFPVFLSDTGKQTDREVCYEKIDDTTMYAHER